MLLNSWQALNFDLPETYRYRSRGGESQIELYLHNIRWSGKPVG